MPVVDSIGRLLGRITFDDVMDQVRESTERDYQLASGLSSDVEGDDTLFTQTKARLPWLLIGMVGGLGNSLILGNYESGLAADPHCPLHPPYRRYRRKRRHPVVAIVVQGLANGSMDIKETLHASFLKLGVGLINGCIISLLVFIYNFLKFGSMLNVTTVAVSLSLLCVVLFASVFGTFVPLTLERFKVDPRLPPALSSHHQRHHRHAHIHVDKHGLLSSL